ncbi:hypothetical protein TWF694_001194 [Orbilia ellipsospora]|uniref:Uncharacterized protein n=1 Tax=Orbilia ellipsospora TaxID=2528407 RepID=A0AAV9XRQ0_9PEZI
MVRTVSLLAATTTFAAFARAQSNPSAEPHIFDIFPPVPCDANCKKAQPNYFPACGTDMTCLYNGSKCGNWAGYKNYCCLQNLPQRYGNITCDDIAPYLESFDFNKDGTAAVQAHADNAADIQCPSGAQSFTGTADDTNAVGAGITGSCCSSSGDAVAFIPVNNSLIMPTIVRCIPRLGGQNGGLSTTSGSAPSPTSGGSGGSTPSTSSKPNTAERMAIVSGLTFGVAILLAIGLAF